MIGNFSPCSARQSPHASRLVRRCLPLVAAAAIASTAMPGAAAAPVAGDRYAYRVINGYNNETRGQNGYCVERNDAGRVVVAATANRDGAQSSSTEVYTPDGNWLTRTLTDHDQLTDYEFSPAFPAYDFPLVAGKQWSTRVNALDTATGAQRSMRVDTTVGGSERIRVPAGEFDAIRISRSIYAGDADMPRATQTTVIETEWYAPSIGRSVRKITRSTWLILSRRPPTTLGDWSIYELLPLSAETSVGC